MDPQSYINLYPGSKKTSFANFPRSPGTMIKLLCSPATARLFTRCRWTEPRVCPVVAIQFHLRLNPIRAQPGEGRQSKLSITMVSHLPITPHCGGLIRALWKCIQTILDHGICLLQGLLHQPAASSFWDYIALWECVECKYLCDAAHLVHNMVYGFIFRSFHTRHQRARLMCVSGLGTFWRLGHYYRLFRNINHFLKYGTIVKMSLAP